MRNDDEMTCFEKKNWIYFNDRNIKTSIFKYFVFDSILNLPSSHFILLIFLNSLKFDVVSSVISILDKIFLKWNKTFQLSSGHYHRCQGRWNWFSYRNDFSCCNGGKIRINLSEKNQTRAHFLFYLF